MLSKRTRRAIAVGVALVAMSLGGACRGDSGSRTNGKTSTTDVNGSVTSGPANKAPVDVSPG